MQFHTQDERRGPGLSPCFLVHGGTVRAFVRPAFSDDVRHKASVVDFATNTIAVVAVGPEAVGDDGLEASAERERGRLEQAALAWLSTKRGAERVYSMTTEGLSRLRAAALEHGRLPPWRARSA